MTHDVLVLDVIAARLSDALKAEYADGWRLVHAEFFEGSDNYEPSYTLILEREVDHGCR